MNNKEFYKNIYNNNDEFKIWKKLDNGCYIATMGYSPKNVKILMTLLKSFEEQYGEEITYSSASDELNLYATNGKLFIYLDEFMHPVSMNGITYNEENISVDFKHINNKTIKSLYFYGLSTIHEYRGKGACRTLINFAIEYAYYNNFDLVYARTDLINSNSEWLMARAGMKVCENNEGIIAEWVNVSDTQGDYRLHLWLPLKDGLYLEKKKDAIIANSITREIVKTNHKVKTLTKKPYFNNDKVLYNA
jgi:hypothetical protein